MRFLLAFSFIFTSIAGFAQHQDGMCSHAKLTHALFAEKSNLRRAASDLQNYDIVYHRLELTASPNKFYLQGAVTSYFRFTQNSNTIAFNLRNHMTVDSVTQRSAKLNFSHSQDVLTIELPSFYSIGHLDSVTVHYQGDASKGKYRSFFIESHLTGRILASQSEPYGAPDWWPCKQDLTDKFDSCDFIITTDTGNLAGGPGLLVSSTIKNDTQVVYHWKHRYPSNFYLLALAISNYEVIEDSVLIRGKQLPLLNYVYPQSVQPSISLLKNTIPLMQYFDSVFGPYPYINEKYGHMQWNRSGGMEHATMSSMGNYSFDLVSHELAHQWFGDMVTCSSWQDIWLNESFATYLNALSYQPMYGKDSFYFRMGGVLERAKKETDLSIFVEDTSTIGSIFNQNMSYQKGAMVLHTLRFHIGDTAFFEGCRNFLADPNLAYASASTADLIGHFQSQTNKDVGVFLSSHYYGKGYPSYLVRWNYKNGKAFFDISQSTNNTSTTFFRQTIPIHIETDTGIYIWKVEMEKAFEQKEFASSLEVKNVFFNKNNEIIAAGTAAKKESSVTDDLAIFPNPSDGNFTIESNKTPIEHVYIYDALGKLIRKELDLNKYTVQLMLPFLSEGNYILQIETKDNKYVKRYAKW